MKQKMALFVGNGFSIGFVQHLGLSADHDNINLFPPPKWVQEWYLQRSGMPLWCPERYPALYAKWEELYSTAADKGRPTFFDLCRNIAPEKAFHIGPDPIQGPNVIFVSHDPGFQLRRYLWHLFSTYALALQNVILPLREDGSSRDTTELLEALRDATYEWKLIHFLVFLNECFDLTFICYNYDPYLEMLLYAYFPQGDHRLQAPRNVREFEVIYPHGSIASYYPNLREQEIPISDEIFTEKALYVILHSFRDFYPVLSQLPPRYVCPDYPDLVPPGHNHHHLVSRFMDREARIFRVIRSANVIGCLGFSAAPPDDVEFQSFLTGTSPSLLAESALKNTFSIGRSDGVPPRSAEILRSAVGADAYNFCDVSELETCTQWLIEQGAISRSTLLASRYVHSE